MITINNLSDVRGNDVVIYSIKTLLEKRKFPKLSIFAGAMGVGKTSVANVVGKLLQDQSEPLSESANTPITYNLGMTTSISTLQQEVFSLNPLYPRAFIFEEMHGLSRNEQNALLQMFDTQPSNVYIICTTTELYKIIGTIRSRAQVWEFKSLSDKQMANLLEDYLKERNTSISESAKQALLRASRGIPRDLLKNTDFAISGEFNAHQLDSIFGNVSENFLYAIFCSLKSNSAEFSLNIRKLLEDTNHAGMGILRSMRDFWTRYILERKGDFYGSISKDMRKQLDALFNEGEMRQVAKTLIRSTTDTLPLELVYLNLQLNGMPKEGELLGKQDEIARESESMQRQSESSILEKKKQESSNSSRLSSLTVRGFKL